MFLLSELQGGCLLWGGAYLVGVRWIYVHAQLHTRGFLERRANQYAQQKRPKRVTRFNK